MITIISVPSVELLTPQALVPSNAPSRLALVSRQNPIQVGLNVVAPPTSAEMDYWNSLDFAALVDRWDHA
jgi:hypothetical protein